MARAKTPGGRLAFDLYNWNGAPPDGGTNAPDIEAATFLDPATGTGAAEATTWATPGEEVVPGLWQAMLTQVSPYPAGGPPPITATVGGIGETAQFDPAVVASSGNTSPPPAAGSKPNASRPAGITATCSRSSRADLDAIALGAARSCWRRERAA